MEHETIRIHRAPEITEGVSKDDRKAQTKKKGKKIKSCMRFVNSFVGSARLIKKKVSKH